MQESEKKAKEFFMQEFGIEEKAFDGKKILKIGKSYWLVSSDFNEIVSNIQTRGIRILHETKLGLKPTSFALQYFGKHIKKRICEVNEKELKELLEGKSVAKKVAKGYVALQFRGQIIGCALSKGNYILNQLPKLLMDLFSEILKENS